MPDEKLHKRGEPAPPGRLGDSMTKEKLYDTHCLELANYFLDHKADCLCARSEELAEAIQTVVDEWLDNDAD